MSSWCKLLRVLGRRGLVADYIAAVRGTMAMRRERGQVFIELMFAGAAMIVAFVGLYTIGIKGQDAESADAGRSALGLPIGDDLADRDSPISIDDDRGQADAADPGTTGDATGTTGADGTGGTAAPGTPTTSLAPGVLPSETSPGANPPRSSVPGGQGGGGTSTSLLPTSTTPPSSGPSTTDPGQPSTSTPTTQPDPNVLQNLLDLLGLG
jgi:hypothetical protein